MERRSRYDLFQQVAMLRLKIPEAELEPRSQMLLNLSKTSQKDDQGRVNALMEQINAEAQNASTKGITTVEWNYLGRPQQLRHLVIPDEGSLRTGAGSQKPSPVRQAHSSGHRIQANSKVAHSPMRSAGTAPMSPMQYFERYSYDASRTHQRISQNQLRLKQIADAQQQHEDETRQRQIEDLESRKRRDDERAEEQAKRHEALKARQQQVMNNYTKNMEAAADELRRQNIDLVNEAAARERLCKSQKADRAKAMGATYNQHLAETLDRKKRIIEAEHSKKIASITRNGLRGTHFAGEFDWNNKTQKQNQSDWNTYNTYNHYSGRGNLGRSEKLEKLEQRLRDAQQKAEDRYNKKMADRVNYLSTYRGNYDKMREERARDREEALQQKIQARNTHTNQVKQRNQAAEEAMIARMDNFDSSNRVHLQRVRDVQQRRFDHIADVSAKQLLNYELARQRRKELVQLGEMQGREIQAKLDSQSDRVGAFLAAKRLRNEQNVQLETFLESIHDPAARRELVNAHTRGIDVVGNALISNGIVYTPEQEAVLEKIKNERSTFQSKTQAAADSVKKMTTM